MSKSDKRKMATSREVYDRILWDARLNPSAFIIGYRERTSEDKIWEKPFLKWQPNGDIPWHRIRYIRCQETVVWDRDRHLDLLSTGELPAAAWVTHNELASENFPFEARSVYGYGSSGWQVVERTLGTAKLNSLKIVSFNVLWDNYESEIIHTAKRIPVISEHLRCCDADIIGLQEATPQLLEFLLTQNWVRDYFISESPSGSTLHSHGILLLSRSPFTLVEHQYSAHKRVFVGTWLFNDRPLRVAAVHLTSDRAYNAIEKRTLQLNILFEYLKTQPGECLIVGDFNSRDNELGEILAENNFIDVWQLLHPEEVGYTFDPPRNPLAALMSLTGKAARFDRILLRDESKHCIPHSIELFACDPIPDTERKLYPSDHFGVRAMLEYTHPETRFLGETGFLSDVLPVYQSFVGWVEARNPTNALGFARAQPNLQRNGEGIVGETGFLCDVLPVYQSAVVVIPPAEFWPAIQTIRRRFDRSFHRWMPHINLIYGFVPEEYFEAALKALAQTLKQIKPFQITLEGFDTFTHRSSSTAWLRPVADPPEALHQLQSVLQQLFPQCDEQSKKSPNGFTPHLSVGQFPSSEEAFSQLPSWHPVSFPVESVALISRCGDEPFEVRYLVHLGEQNEDIGVVKLLWNPTPNPSPSHGEGSNTVRFSPPSLVGRGVGGVGFSDPNSIGEGRTELVQLINKLEPQLSQTQQAHRETILSIIAQACAECLGFQPSLHLLGSARLGVQSPQSDLDIVCLIPAHLSGQAFLESVQQKLVGLCDRSNLVEDARMPVLRMQIEGLSVDLLYARTTAEPSKFVRIKESDREFFDPVSWQAVSSCLASDLIAEAVQKRIPLASFQELLRAVRAWAKARQIHGNAWGFMGNFSWALLAAWSCTNYPLDIANIEIETLLVHFFQMLVQHDWTQPVSLTEAGKLYRPRLPRDWLPVVTPIEPCQNSARNVSRSTAQILQNEFVRAAKIAEQVLAGEVGWSSFFESIEIEKESKLLLVVTATSEDNESLEGCGGWLEGNAIGLVIYLEQQLNASVRPWPGIKREQNRSKIVLGLQVSESCDRATIEQIAKEFVTRSYFGNNFSIELLT
ncbi:poly(A) polymerase [Argonema galeatum]|uniref:poly(A) polymerase n=1 Tax=Argonema galeatum TaxID=2942762 RepID=UPI0020117571|nr:poly(A) polymerase [Argonema galeatum]MCL1468089.1 RNA repair domain-containing protein [Argonema galeatum A003/A1]